MLEAAAKAADEYRDFERTFAFISLAFQPALLEIPSLSADGETPLKKVLDKTHYTLLTFLLAQVLFDDNGPWGQILWHSGPSYKALRSRVGSKSVYRYIVHRRDY